MRTTLLLFSLALTSVVHAGTICTPGPNLWCEGQGGVGDAGQNLATYQYTVGTAGPGPGGPLLNIIGNLNGINGADLYDIYIGNPGSFAASFSAVPGGANANGVQNGGLFLYDINGNGIEAVAGPGGSLGAFVGSAGFYLISISSGGNVPQYAGANAIFTAFSGTSISFPVNGAGPLNDYSNSGCGLTTCGGGYNIAFAAGGVQYSNSPEPSTALLTTSWLAGLALISIGRSKR